MDSYSRFLVFKVAIVWLVLFSATALQFQSSHFCCSNHIIRRRILGRVGSLNAQRKGKSSSESSQQVSATNDDKRSEVLVNVLGNIERCYGKGSILKLGEAPRMHIETFSSGCLTLDHALGGGYPRGRVIEIYGPESSGKTTLALHAIAEIQKLNGTAAFIDAEHALDPIYAGHLGVRVNELLVSQPDSGEMALDVVDQLVRSSAVDVVIIDSVAALVPRVELEGDMTDQQMGLQARLMSKALRKLTGSLSKSKTTVIFLNQLRSKIGIMFGNPEVTSGGNALKFYSSVRIDIRKTEVLKDNAGVRVRCKVVKNKVAPPFRLAEFDINFGSGIDKVGCLVDLAEQIKILDRKGSWYYYRPINPNNDDENKALPKSGKEKEEAIAQGRAGVVALLKANEVLRNDVERQIKLHLAQHSHRMSPAEEKEAAEAESEVDNTNQLHTEDDNPF